MRHKYHYRRMLPHLQPDYKAFFITFVTAKRWHLPPDCRSVVLDCILRGNGHRFRLHGAVVMPDHVHLVLNPLADEHGAFSLCQINQAIKGASAHRINRILQRKGPVWQDESFDHALRKEEGILIKVEYILLNPVRAGLVSDPKEYRWSWCEAETSMPAVARARTPVPTQTPST